ncbi:MAG TPA: helix-hairpin-helix domain-containing protein [Ramlibacter sp.]|nr:helix-hairpin-helix domain-containing protein [Ramlibacter sp.]
MLKKILALLFMLATSLAMAAVDVNKATEAELDSVKGIGPGTSKAILDERKKGNFKNWDDFISRVKGVGENRAANLSEAGLRVNGRSFQATTARKDDAKAADKKEAKSDAKAEKKEAKSDAKAEKKEAKAEAKADAAKPAASAAKK